MKGLISIGAALRDSSSCYAAFAKVEYFGEGVPMSWRKKLEGPVGAVVAAGLAVGMGFMGIDNNTQLAKGRELARDGIQTTATVTAMRTSGRKSRTYHVSYRYRAGGQERAVDGKMDSDSYYALAEGMVIPVRFDAAHPGRRNATSAAAGTRAAAMNG